ncbi:MAG: DUF6580 family putative transport protein [Candidatus Thermoplasmatota archaeon]
MISKYIKEEYYRPLAAVVLIAAGVIGRLSLNQLLPETPSIYITLNGVTQPMFMMDLFFVVAVISIISGLILGGYYTFIVPISVMTITDVIIGNNFVMLFTWSGFIILGLIGYILKNKNSFSLNKTPTILGSSIAGVLLYDIWTNFGCWLGGMYPQNLNGLILCYTMALPFTFWHLLSTSILMASIIIPVLLIKEKGLIKTDFQPSLFEKRATIATSLIFFSLVLCSAIV